jgi:ribosomal-protein-serine acetyltransferase
MFTHRIDAALELRLLELRHTEDLFTLIDENRQHLREWLMWADDMYTYGDARDFIRQGLKQFAENDGFQAGIWVEGALAGCIGFHSIDWNNRHTELGYWLGKAFTGRGVMTHAVSAMLDHAFDTWRLHRVEIRCAAGNQRSRAIPERLGFHLDGVMREELWLHDHYVDHVVYSTLASEWWSRRR